jgi:hypothetical protein
MDKGKRQQRLIQKVRNLSKWLKRERVKANRSGVRFTVEDEKNAHIEANHGKRCSCHMCCNPRRSRFNKGTGRLTLQERKADEKANDGYEEFPD